jgi:hypothetical protein
MAYEGAKTLCMHPIWIIWVASAMVYSTITPQHCLALAYPNFPIFSSETDSKVIFEGHEINVLSEP